MPLVPLVQTVWFAIAATPRPCQENEHATLVEQWDIHLSSTSDLLLLMMMMALTLSALTGKGDRVASIAEAIESRIDAGTDRPDFDADRGTITWWASCRTAAS
ncbi:MAG: hypothetical protein R3B90_04870 [Planctomycetaceae bacterium]